MTIDESQELLVERLFGRHRRAAGTLGSQQKRGRNAQINARISQIDLTQRRTLGLECFRREFVDGGQHAAHDVIEVRVRIALRPARHQFARRAADQKYVLNLEPLAVG